MTTKPDQIKFTVIRDSREQNGWTFLARARCQGTEVGTLKTGDYAIKGLEDK
jgi:hypothetical protein